MKLKITFALFVFVIGLQAVVCAQKTTAKKTTTFVKFKPPKLTTTLGVITDSAQAPIEQIKAVLENKLTINDAAKKGIYTIQSYQFIYRRRSVTEDEQGNVSPTTSVSSQAFYNAGPLPDIWIKTIREELKPGEEIYFFDIIVKDNLGRIMYAPDLKIFAK